MLFRFHIQTLSRKDEEATEDKLRELGLDSWELVSVLPGTRKDPADPDHFTFFFKRDATTDIGF